MAATTDLGKREEEARRIARANGAPIVQASADWTFFTLGDGETIGQEGSDGRGFMAGRTIRTHFTWEGGRFEGFVS